MPSVTCHSVQGRQHSHPRHLGDLGSVGKGGEGVVGIRNGNMNLKINK